MNAWIWRRRARVFAGAAVLLFVTSCGRHGDARNAGAEPSIPLFQDLDSLTVLGHEDRLAMPASPPGNRFLRGWWPIRHPGSPRLVPLDDGAWIELVRTRLEAARLHLVFDERKTRDLAEIRAVARTGSRTLVTGRDDASLFVEIPADLDTGRHAIELRFAPREHPIFVRGGVLRPRRETGKAGIDDGAICLHGDVHVESLRDDIDGGRLVGHFTPPPEDGRRFTVEIEQQGEAPRAVFSWPGGCLRIPRRSTHPSWCWST